MIARDSAAGGEASRRDVVVSGQSAPARRVGGRWAWRDLRDFTPFRLVDGLGSALSQVAEALGRPLEDGGDGDGEWWSATGYHASLVLPDDARAERITAEKDGVLYVTVPRSGEHKRNVTEVKVQ